MEGMAAPRRWLFGDQLGPHFLDSPDQTVLMVEAKRVFARRRFHRQKAHLVLSAMRHRAAELGDQCRYVKSETYRPALRGKVTVCHPTTRAALTFVESLDQVEVLPARGFATSMADFGRWADGRQGKRLILEDFYRRARVAHDVLMDGDQPAGGKWNFDHDNRKPPPRSGRLTVAEPWWPTEDEIDEEVRHDLDRWQADGAVSFIGDDGPRRFAATRSEALTALRHFISERLDTFGPYEDAMLSGNAWLAHSLLSAPLNLGLLDPLEVVRQVEQAYRDKQISIASAEGFIRQLIGWRDYVWHLYWYQPDSYRRHNALQARRKLPDWFAELDADRVEANCLSSILKDVREHGWVHHIPRLMVLGNYAMQRGWHPAEVTDWFHRAFVDGYDWVMVPNVIGMSQYADGGLMMTKPYAGGGSYIDRMSNYCGPCAYDPKLRTGEQACPFTAGYWAFMHRHREKLAGNHRIAQPLRAMWNLRDLDELLVQEQDRGSNPP